MTLTLNGTSGVTTPGISNSEGYTGDGLTIAAGAPAGAMTLDASGNLGVGTSSFAIANRCIVKQSADNSAAGLGFRVERNSNDSSIFIGYRDNTDTWQINAPYISTGAFKPITFHTADAERMRLDASGNLLVGTTSTDPTYNRVNGTVITAGGAIYSRSNNGWDRGISTSSGTQISFYTDNGARVSAGSIASNGSSTSYNTSSDYRLKENVQPMTNALDKIAALKPVTYNWKVDGSADRGFIAHELQEVIPQAVYGEKDAVDDKGNIMPQGVDYGKITPEIVKAIQEQQAMITELKARIEQLETK